MKQFFSSLLFFLFAAILSAQAPTEVTVRVLAKDAKFIGSSMGGAKIVITDVNTGDTLAQGLTEGATGETDIIIKKPRERYEKLYTEGAAKFVAVLNLKEPTFINVSATSTFMASEEVTSSTQLWVFPEKDITGNGITLEMPGFVVDIMEPDTKFENNKISIKAHIVMMCGCPTEPGGLWDSSDYDIEAYIKKNGKLIAIVPMSFSGETSIFEATYMTDEEADYEVLVTAFHLKTVNSGLDKINLKHSN